jgi:hypothetical protein
MRNLPDFSTPGARYGQKLRMDDIVFGSGFERADGDAGDSGTISGTINGRNVPSRQF